MQFAPFQLAPLIQGNPVADAQAAAQTIAAQAKQDPISNFMNGPPPMPAQGGGQPQTPAPVGSAQGGSVAPVANGAQPAAAAGQQGGGGIMDAITRAFGSGGGGEGLGSIMKLIGMLG